MHVNKSVSIEIKALNIIDEVMAERGHSFSVSVNNIIIQWYNMKKALEKQNEQERSKQREVKDESNNNYKPL